MFQQNIREEQMRQVFGKFKNNIKVVKAEQCGYGKSQYIRNYVQKDGKQLVRIPIYGDLNRLKLIRMHARKLQPVL